MEEEGDEMGSLFEGMILFNPTPSEPPPPLAPSSSLPLDEDLFSDLTISSPKPLPETLTPVSTPAVSPLLSRQVSSTSTRKKKKALSGIRIGYGNKDSSFTDDFSSSVVKTVGEGNVEVKLDIVESELLLKSINGAKNGTSEIKNGVFDKKNRVPKFREPEGGTPEVESNARKLNNGFSEVKDGTKGLETDKPYLLFNDPELTFETPELEVEEKVLIETLDLKGEVAEEEQSNVGSASVSGVEAEGERASTEEQLEQIRVGIAEKLEVVRGLALSLSTARKEAAKKRRKVVEELNLASTKFEELEVELEEACESEDFERAEVISENIVVAEKEKERFVILLRDAEGEYDSVDSKVQEILEMQIEAEQEGIILLEQFAKDATDNAELVLNSAKESYSKEMGEWQSSVELFEGKRMELEIQSHIVNDVRVGLNESIELTVKDSKIEREVLSNKRDMLMKELEILLSLVKQKEEEIADNDFNIQEVEKKIDTGVSVFHNSQIDIDMQYQNIQKLLVSTHADNEALLLKKKETEDFLSEDEKRVNKLRDLACKSMAEAKTCQELLLLRQSLALPIFKSREAKLKLIKIEEKILGEIHTLAEEVSNLRASLQVLTSARLSLQQEIASSKERMIFIDKRIPDLESQKKVATSSRNFKEAGRVAAEVKTIIAERQNIEIKTKASALQLEKIEKEIKDTSETLCRTEELILLKEKDVAMAKWEKLCLESAASKAERSAALKLGDLEEANILLAEAEAFETQAKELQPSYDLEEFRADSLQELISMELIANLEGHQLLEMTTSVYPPPQ